LFLISFFVKEYTKTCFCLSGPDIAFKVLQT
jgi:hypothetical protein